MYRLSIGLFIVGLAIGCGGGTTNTEMVKGLVTLDGEPVAGATVMFRPMDGGMSAAGTTDERGIYTLTSSDPSASGGGGTNAGEYLVTVVKIAGGDEGGDYTGLSDEEIDALEAKMSEEGDQGDAYEETETAYIVPKKYSDFDSSGLKVTVSAGENDIPLQLTSE